MKKIIAVLLSLLTLGTQFNLALAVNVTGKNTLEPTPVTEGGLPQENGGADSDKPDDKAGSLIQEQVIHDKDGIKITLKSLELKGVLYGPELRLTVLNSSQKDIIIQSNGAAINGAMVEAYISCYSAAGEETEDSIIFLDDELKNAGIMSIAQIDIQFVLLDAGTMKTIETTELLTIETSLSKSYKQDFDFSGQTVFKERGYRVVVQGYSEDEGSGFYNINMILENNSAQNALIRIQDVEINKRTARVASSSIIWAGKLKIDSISISKSDLEAMDINKIKEIEFTFNIMDLYSKESIIKSAPVVLK